MSKSVSEETQKNREKMFFGWFGAVMLCIPIAGMLFGMVFLPILTVQIFTRSNQRGKDFTTLLLGVGAYFLPLGIFMLLAAKDIMNLFGSVVLLALQVFLTHFFLAKFNHLGDSK